jgi:hypothetical protein
MSMNKLVVVALAGAMAVVGCEDKGAGGTASSGSAAGSGKPAPSGDTKPAKSAEPPAAKALTAAQFTTDATAAGCKTLVGCKNQEFSVAVGATFMMMAGFAGMDDKSVEAEMKAVGDGMEKDKRNVMNADECGKVMAVVAKVTGFTGEKLQAAIDAKRVEFNGEKAAACAAQLGTEPPFCKEEKKVEGEPKLGELDKMMDAFEKPLLEEHLKVCKEALVGKVAAGAACEADYECTGEKTKCKDKKCIEKK